MAAGNEIILEENFEAACISNRTSNKYIPVKNIFDFICAFLGLIILSPVLLAVAVMIKAGTRGPVLYKHKRKGLHNSDFYLYKFCTMVPDAEKLIATFSEAQKREFRENFKLSNDPRVTPIGRILRKTSLDELPQLINILKGDISLVGPRPVVNDELSKYGSHVGELLSVKPGLTGMWQANGRSSTTYEERVNMDITYIRNMSFSLDAKIVLKTFRKVFKCEGAF